MTGPGLRATVGFGEQNETPKREEQITSEKLMEDKRFIDKQSGQFKLSPDIIDDFENDFINITTLDLRNSNSPDYKLASEYLKYVTGKQDAELSKEWFKKNVKIDELASVQERVRDKGNTEKGLNLLVTHLDRIYNLTVVAEKNLKDQGEIRRLTEEEIQNLSEEEQQEYYKRLPVEGAVSEGLSKQADEFVRRYGEIYSGLRHINIQSFFSVLSNPNIFPQLKERLWKGRKLYMIREDKWLQLGYNPDGAFGGTELKQMNIIYSHLHGMEIGKRTEFINKINHLYQNGLTIMQLNDKFDNLGEGGVNKDNFLEIFGTSYRKGVASKVLEWYETQVKGKPDLEEKFFARMNELGMKEGQFSIYNLMDNLNLLVRDGTFGRLLEKDLFIEQQKIKKREINKAIEDAKQKIQDEIDKLKGPNGENAEKNKVQIERLQGQLKELNDSTSSGYQSLINGLNKAFDESFVKFMGAGLAITSGTKSEYNSISLAANFQLGDYIKFSIGAGSAGLGGYLGYSDSKTIDMGKHDLIISFDTGIAAGIGANGIAVGWILSGGLTIEEKAKLGRDSVSQVGIRGSLAGPMVSFNFGFDKNPSAQKQAELLKKQAEAISNAKSKEEIIQIMSKAYDENRDDKIKENPAVKTQYINQFMREIENTYQHLGIQPYGTPEGYDEKENGPYSYIREQALIQMINNKIEKIQQNDADRTKEVADFTGAGIGVAIGLGVVVPMAYLTWTKTDVDVKHGDLLNERKLTKEEKLKLEREKLPSEISKKYADFVLSSRDDPQFRKFQKAVTNGDGTNFSDARQLLLKYLSNAKSYNIDKKAQESAKGRNISESNFKKQAEELYNIIEKNNDKNSDELLFVINSLSSGSEETRKLGKQIGKEIKLTDKEKNILIGPDGNSGELGNLKASMIDRLGGSNIPLELKTQIENAYNLDNYLNSLQAGQLSDLKPNQIGLVDYRQKRGAADGLSPMHLGMRYLLPQGENFKELDNSPQSDAILKTLLNSSSYNKMLLLNTVNGKLHEMFKDDKFKIDETQMMNLLSNKEIEVNGQKVKLDGKVKYSFAYSAVDGATCTNGGYVIEIPDIDIVGETTYKDMGSGKKSFDILKYGLLGAYVIDNNKTPEPDNPPEPEQPDEPEEPGDRTRTDPNADKTTTLPSEGKTGDGSSSNITQDVGTSNASAVINIGGNGGAVVPGGRQTQGEVVKGGRSG